MADSLELVLQVRPAPGDDSGELAELAGWLRGELPGLDVQGGDRLRAEAVPVGAKGSAGIAGLLLVQLDPKALQVVLAKVADWMARSDRVVEISAGGHTLKLGPPIHQQQEKVVDGSLVPGTEVSRVRPKGETEAVIEVSPSVVPNRGSSALEPGKALVPRESLPLIRQSPREGSELSKANRLADARLLVKGRINIATLPGQEFRRTAAFAGISSLLGSGFVVLLSIIILAIAKHYHGFSISTSYPVHRVYQDIVRYIVLVTPPPGSPHMLLVYTVYLAVLPVLFAVVFMHLKVGSSRLFVAAVACVVFMAAPFIIVITSVRVGSTNCGSWNYPELNSGSECYNALAIDFRIAFAAGVVGLTLPIIYLIRGKNKSLLLRALEACASVVMALFRFISYIARQARGGRDVATDQNAEAAVGRYLLSHERQVIIVRRHPAILIGPSVLTFVWAVAAVVLTATILRDNEPLATAVWIVWLVLFVRMIWKAINWTGTFFAVTSQRLLLISGALTKKTEMLPLTKVTDMSFQRSFTGRLLGFGEFIIESAGVDQTLQTVDYIPFPEQLYLEICGLIFMPPDKGDSDD